MTTSVITNNARAFISTNSSMGLQVSVAGAVFGSQIISSDIPTLEAISTMPNEVFRLTNTASISYSQIDDDNVRFRIRLGNDIGTFNIGAFGLLLPDGTLFTLSSLDATEQKSKAATAGSGGNIRFYETIVNISSVANIVNLSIFLTDDASLPEVATENDLPNPNSSSFPVYFVHQWLAYRSENALASRFNGVWNFYPCFDGGNRNLFAANVVPGDAVYFDVPTGLFTHAISGDVIRSPIGLCGEDYCLVRLGGLYKSPSSIYSAGSNYYVDGNNPGKLTTTPFIYHVGYAVTANILSVNNIPDSTKVINNSLTIYSDTSYASSLLIFNKSDAPANGKLWSFGVNNNDLSMSISDDSYNTSAVFFSAVRSNYNIQSITMAVQNSSLSMTNSNMRYDVPNGALIMSPYFCQLITSNSGVAVGNNDAILYAPSSSLSLQNGSINWSNNTGSFISMNSSDAVIALPGANLTITPNQSVLQAGPFAGVQYAVSINASGVNIQTLAGPVAYMQLSTSAINTNLQINTDSIINSAVQSDGSRVISGRSAPTLISEFIYRKDVNGYQRFPSGIIMQWGNGVTPTGYLDLIYFPVSFLNYCCSITVNEAATGGWRNDSGIGYPTIFGVAKNNAASFFLSCIRVDTSEGYGTPYQSNISYNYIAIGF